MIQRCTNGNNPNYHNYGGRGICVCTRWRTFKFFYEDMGPRPSNKHTIERVDNSKGYYKNNCKWATQKEQCNNTRRNRTITVNGETKTVQQWAEVVGINANTIIYRLRRGWDEAAALSVEIKKGMSPEKAKRVESERESRRRLCIECGKSFSPRKYQIDTGTGLYCSNRCSLKKAIRNRVAANRDRAIVNRLTRGIVK